LTSVLSSLAADRDHVTDTATYARNS